MLDARADYAEQVMDERRANLADLRDYALATGDYDPPEHPVDEVCNQCGNERWEGHEPTCPRARVRR